MVIVEASSLRLTTPTEFEDTKKYISQFFKQYIATLNSNAHFSLATFAKTMSINIPLGRYDHSKVNEVLQKIFKIGLRAENEIRTELALMEAADMLDRHTTKGHHRKVIVPVLRHGTSPKGQQSGFDLVRNVVMNLQQKQELHGKFQVVPVWIGKSLQLIQAISMASPPKHTNRLLFKNSKEILTSSSVEHLTSSILKGIITLYYYYHKIFIRLYIVKLTEIGS